MTKEKMTMHKALAEKKLLGDRIMKTIRGASFCVANKKSNGKIGGQDIKVYKEATKADFQACRDLIDRYNALNRAIMLSNATTKVSVGGVEYTVAEAIAMKNHGMTYEQGLMRQLVNQLEYAQSLCDEENSELTDVAKQEAEKIFGDDVKDRASKMEEYIKTRIEQGTYEVVSGIKCAEEIAALEKKINDFMPEIDAALSVSNATTEIEIEY